MVYTKKVKPSDVYGADAEVRINNLLQREAYQVISFRPTEPGDHFVAKDGCVILGCCSADVYEPRIIVSKRVEALSGLWE